MSSTEKVHRIRGVAIRSVGARRRVSGKISSPAQAAAYFRRRIHDDARGSSSLCLSRQSRCGARSSLGSSTSIPRIASLSRPPSKMGCAVITPDDKIRPHPTSSLLGERFLQSPGCDPIALEQGYLFIGSGRDRRPWGTRASRSLLGSAQAPRSAATGRCVPGRLLLVGFERLSSCEIVSRVASTSFVELCLRSVRHATTHLFNAHSTRASRTRLSTRCCASGLIRSRSSSNFLGIAASPSLARLAGARGAQSSSATEHGNRSALRLAPTERRVRARRAERPGAGLQGALPSSARRARRRVDWRPWKSRSGCRRAGETRRRSRGTTLAPAFGFPR
jgi:hypothetical protein